MFSDIYLRKAARVLENKTTNIYVNSCTYQGKCQGIYLAYFMVVSVSKDAEERKRVVYEGSHFFLIADLVRKILFLEDLTVQFLEAGY